MYSKTILATTLLLGLACSVSASMFSSCSNLFVTPATCDLNVCNTTGGHVLSLSDGSLTSGYTQFVFANGYGNIKRTNDQYVVSGRLVPAWDESNGAYAFDVSLILVAATHASASGSVDVDISGSIDASASVDVSASASADLGDCPVAPFYSVFNDHIYVCFDVAIDLDINVRFADSDEIWNYHPNADAQAGSCHNIQLPAGRGAVQWVQVNGFDCHYGDDNSGRVINCGFQFCNPSASIDASASIAASLDASASIDIDVSASASASASAAASAAASGSLTFHGMNTLLANAKLDMSLWQYFSLYATGTLTGAGLNAGRKLSVSLQWTDVPFQVGVGANGKNLNYGAGMWAKIAEGATTVSGEINVNLNCFDCLTGSDADNANNINNNGGVVVNTNGDNNSGASLIASASLVIFSVVAMLL